MDYTNSLDHVIDPNTGQRMHQDDQAVTTVWSARDSNAINWELMEIVKAGGINPRSFNPTDPESYNTVLRALLAILVQKGKAIAYYDIVPTAQAEPVIYVAPYGLMHWEATVGMYRSTDCGAVLLHPSAMPPPGTVKANGATLSKTTYAGLWSWANENGLVVASASWAAGTAFYAELGGDSFRLPDLRGEFLRTWDDGRGVDSGRGVGTWQDGTYITGDNGIGPAVHGIGNLATVNVDPPDGVARDLYHMPTTNILSDKYSYWGRVRPRNVALTACIKF